MVLHWDNSYLCFLILTFSFANSSFQTFETHCKENVFNLNDFEAGIFRKSLNVDDFFNCSVCKVLKHLWGGLFHDCQSHAKVFDVFQLFDNPIMLVSKYVKEAGILSLDLRIVLNESSLSPWTIFMSDHDLNKFDCDIL